MSVYKSFLTVTLVIILNEGTTVNGAINMPCPRVCPGAAVQYTCTITGDNAASWSVRDASGAQLGPTLVLVESIHGIGVASEVGTSPFSAKIDSYTENVELVATISYNGTMDVTGYQVQCGDSQGSIPAICTVEEQEIPSAPTNLTLSSFAAGSVSLTFDSPDNDDCVANYTISLNGNTLTPTIDTSVIITKPDGDPPYTTYALSIAAVDTGGRTGSSASIDCFLFSGPEAIVLSTEVKLCTSTISSLMTIDVQVEWMVENCLPEITSYLITHNISGVENTEIITGKDNTFTLTDVTSGEIYSLEIVPSNIIGPGQPTTTIISISSYHCSLSSSIIKMAMPSSVSSPTACTSGVGFSSATLGISIVVAIIFSTVASSIVTFLATYFLFVKRNHCKSLKEANGHTEKELSQQAAMYEEVGVTGHSHKIATDSMNITANAAYGQI